MVVGQCASWHCHRNAELRFGTNEDKSPKSADSEIGVPFAQQSLGGSVRRTACSYIVSPLTAVLKPRSATGSPVAANTSAKGRPMLLRPALAYERAAIRGRLALRSVAFRISPACVCLMLKTNAAENSRFQLRLGNAFVSHFKTLPFNRLRVVPYLTLEEFRIRSVWFLRKHKL